MDRDDQGRLPTIEVNGTSSLVAAPRLGYQATARRKTRLKNSTHCSEKSFLHAVKGRRHLGSGLLYLPRQEVPLVGLEECALFSSGAARYQVIGKPEQAFEVT